MTDLNQTDAGDPTPEPRSPGIPAGGCVVPAEPDARLRERACELAARLGWPYTDAADEEKVSLVCSDERLELRFGAQAPGVDTALRKGGPVSADYTAIDTTSPAGRSLQGPLLRACGLGGRRSGEIKPTVFDATAGWAEDAWLLAGAGCRVTACERCRPVAVLVEDGLRRARAADGALRATAERITLIEVDGGRALKAIKGPPDVVYLDPMFSEVRKAAPRNAIKALRWLTGVVPGEAVSTASEDERRLYEAAMASGAGRVVVKRGRRSPALGDQPPDFVRPGKGHRFDVYLRRGSD
ncbi:MAG: class I SAM-dependent methyltransferase [Planctomycetota bacterium]